jgi:hypothetical protein
LSGSTTAGRGRRNIPPDLARGKKRIPRSQADSERQLQEQVGFLRTSSRLYDEGDHAEAKRIAGALRTLLYDQGSCHSLLGQLGMLGLRFTNTNHRFNPRNLAGNQGLLVMCLEQKVDGTVTGSFEPRFLTGPAMLTGGEMPFAVWWEQDPILVDTQRTVITRKDIVRFVANQDGGSHVDRALDAVYHALSRGQALGWILRGPQGEQPMNDPTGPCLRQIAHEVVYTLDHPELWVPGSSPGGRILLQTLRERRPRHPLTDRTPGAREEE